MMLRDYFDVTQGSPQHDKVKSVTLRLTKGDFTLNYIKCFLSFHDTSTDELNFIP